MRLTQVRLDFDRPLIDSIASQPSIGVEGRAGRNAPAPIGRATSLPEQLHFVGDRAGDGSRSSANGDESRRKNEKGREQFAIE